MRAKLALDRLALLNQRKIDVIRAGITQSVAAEAIVQDDLVTFQAG